MPSFFLLKWNLVTFFCPNWLGTTILPISASQVARLPDVSHWCSNYIVGTIFETLGIQQ
jgi:hypothetical protein